jgi:hypothetical protein
MSQNADDFDVFSNQRHIASKHLGQIYIFEWHFSSQNKLIIPERRNTS